MGEVKGVKLDNAALLFSAIHQGEWNVFHTGANLKIKVDENVLEKAVGMLKKRFPYYYVEMKRKLRWYLLVPSDSIPKPELFDSKRCKNIWRGAKNLFRIVYDEYNISVEFHHVLGDANCALEFLNSLLLCYFELLGYEFDDRQMLKDYKDAPSADEDVDDYSKASNLPFQENKEKYIMQHKRAFIVPGILSITGSEQTFFTVSSDDLYAKAKSYGKEFTVHNLLTTYIVKSLMEIAKKCKSNRGIALETAVNFRSMFKSQSMRNFVGVILLCIEQGVYEIEDLIKIVKKNHTEEFNYDKMLAFVKSNSASNKNTKHFPLILKNTVLKYLNKFFIDKASTMSFSNLGVVKTPKKFEDLVEGYEFILGGSLQKHYSCTAIAYAGKTVAAFTRTIIDSTLENAFESVLKAEGIHFSRK